MVNYHRHLTPITAVLVTIISTYPFYGIVEDVSGMKGQDFEPCGDRPCYFIRFFSDGGVPPTAPDLVQVQNGISRPMVLLEDLAHQATVASPVLYERPVPRVLVLGFGRWAGLMLHLWPSTPGDACGGWVCRCFEPCLLGICADTCADERMAEHWQAYQAAVHNYTSSVEGEEALRALRSLGNATKTYDSGFRSWVHAATRHVMHGLELIVLELGRPLGNQGFESQADRLKSARCAGKNATEMRRHCDTEEVRGRIDNFLPKSPMMRCYLAGIVMWALSKALHDVMLLCGVPEEGTLVVGFVSLICQGLAVASGFAAAAGVVEVFVAPVDCKDDMGTACECYYKVGEIRAVLMVASSLILWFAYARKRRIMLQAILCGDFLHYKAYDVPYYLASQNEGSERHELIVPQVRGTEALMENQKRSLPLCLIHRARLLVFLILATNFTILAAGLLVISNVFPVCMMAMLTFAERQDWQRHPSAWLMWRVLLMMPTAISIFGAIMNVVLQGKAWCSTPLTTENVLAILVLHVFKDTVLPIVNLVLICPWAVISGSATLSGEDLHVYWHFWAAGGFTWVLTTGDFITRLIFCCWRQLSNVLLITESLIELRQKQEAGKSVEQIAKPTFFFCYPHLLPDWLVIFGVHAPDFVEKFGLKWLVVLAEKFMKGEMRDASSEGHATWPCPQLMCLSTIYACYRGERTEKWVRVLLSSEELTDWYRGHVALGEAYGTYAPCLAHPEANSG